MANLKFKYAGSVMKKLVALRPRPGQKLGNYLHQTAINQRILHTLEMENGKLLPVSKHSAHTQGWL